MRLVIQRVSGACVRVQNGEVREIGHGLAVLFGAGEGDEIESADLLASKTVYLRIFSDEQGKMNLSALDMGYEILVVPNFTLYADTKKGRRPSFARSGSPDFAKRAYQRYVESLMGFGLTVKTGEFGDDMALTLTNDGPVTIIMDTEEWKNDG